MKGLQRVISFLLALVLLVGMMPPVGVRATEMIAGETVFADSTETAVSPETTEALAEETIETSEVSDETTCASEPPAAEDLAATILAAVEYADGEWVMRELEGTELPGPFSQTHGSGATASGVGDHEYFESEPNNEIYEANYVGNDYTMNGSLSSVDLWDFFEFRPESESNVIIVAAAQKNTLLMALFDGNGNLMGADQTGEYTDGTYIYTLYGTLDSGWKYLAFLDSQKSSNTYMFYIMIVPAETCAHSDCSAVVTEPTCVDQGYTTYTCNSCGHSWTGDPTQATGQHLYTNQEDVTCNYCGEYRGKSVAKGACGENVKWALTDAGVLTIAGTGAMMDYSENSTPPWYSYRSSIMKVVVEEGVTRIGNYAFYECENVSDVFIPDTVVSLGECVFYYCDNLKFLYVPQSVTEMACDYQYTATFHNCYYYLQVFFGAKEAQPGWGKYWDYRSAKIITPNYKYRAELGYTREQYEYWMTLDREQRSITVPSWINQVPGYAFQRAKQLKTVVLPDGILSIGDNAFEGCTLMTSLNVPISVTSIGTDAFEFCDSLVIRYEGTMLQWMQLAYEKANCSDGTILGIGEGLYVDWFVDNTYQLTLFGKGAMPDYSTDNMMPWRSYVSHITSIQILGELTEIGDRAFAGCGKLTSIAIPETVIRIGDYAFSGCASLKSITIPRSISYIGREAFYNDKALKEIIFWHGTNDPLLLDGGAFVIPKGTVATTVKVPVKTAINPAITSYDWKGDGRTVVYQSHNCSSGHAIVYENVVNPTCTQPGSAGRAYCEVCGKIISEASTIPALGHTEVIDEPAVEPTCTESGTTVQSHCSVCEEILSVQTVIPALGHTEVMDAEAAPTCTETGLTEGMHCSACGEILAAQEEIPALGHTEVMDPAADPTCTKTGRTEGKHCSACGKILIDQETIPALGHDFADGFCLVCGTADKADYAVFAGKSLTLKETNPKTGKLYSAKELTWALATEYEPFAVLTAAGKFTANKVFEKTRVEVEGTVTATGEIICRTVDIYPVLTQMEVVCGEKIVANNESVPMDVTDEPMTFTVNVFPEDTLDAVEWTVSDKKNQFADYLVEGDSLTVANPTGKAGTVTIKASVNAGVKKTVTFKIQLGAYAKTVEIAQPDKTTIRGGETLALSAAITEPNAVTKPGIVWGVSDKNAATITNGKLKAKTVTHPVTVTVTATSKDGMANDIIDIRILPKHDGPLVLVHEETYVTNATITLNAGDSYQLEAYTLQGEEAIGEDAVWTSSKKAVAEVDENGRITAMGGGTAKITAQADSRKVTVTVKVSVLVDDMELTTKDGKNLIDENGETMVIVPSGKGVNLVANVLTEGAAKAVTWELISGSQAGKLTAAGKFTANKDLTTVYYAVARATAKDGSNYSEEITLKVVPIAQGIQIYEGGERVRSNTVYTSDLETNSVIRLSAKVYPANAMQAVQWTSSNKKVAYFNEFGELVCSGVGSTNITAAAADGSNQKSTFKLTVVNQISSISLKDEVALDSQGDLFVAAAKSLKLADLVEISPANVTNKKLAWNVSRNDAGIKINASGVLSTKKVTEPVTVTVLAMAQDGSGEYLRFAVTVYPATTKLSLQQDGKDVTSKVLFLKENESISLTAVSQPGNAAGVYSWSTTEEDYVYVDENGTVTALQPGKVVTITCTAMDGSGKEANVKVKVL